MDRKKSLIKKLKIFKDNLNKDMPVYRMVFFGSRAKGKPHRWSDVDLIVVSNKFRGMKFYKRGSRMYDYWTYNYPVDFLCYTPEEFNRLKKQITIIREAVKEGIEI